MVWIRCPRCEKFWRNFVARTIALIALVRPDLHRVWRINEMVPNAPNHYETHQNMSLGSNGMDQVPSLRKIPTRPRCANFCIFCTSWTNLHRVLCSNEMIQMRPNHYKLHKNMSLESNGMDRVPSLRKILTRFCCTNICINCTSSARISTSFTH